jgi:hypothetical protein
LRPGCELVARRRDRDRETGRDEDGPERVEALPVLVEALREEARRQRQGRQADRHVDEEDPLPGEEVGEDPAEEDTGGGTEPTYRPPRAEGDVALAPLPEGVERPAVAVGS